MPEPVQSATAIDADAIEAFESAWLNGHGSTIEAHLPPVDDPRFQNTLEELVHADMEFRWKSAADASARNEPADTPPTAESYLQRFPQLADQATDLIVGEFELATRFGEAPARNGFLDRYQHRVDRNALGTRLERVHNELNRVRAVRPGSRLDRYQIEREHGRGGFGAVWRASDTKLGRRIAVKQLGQSLARDAQSRRRFMSEARVTARLEHPGIVPVYDISNPDDDHAFYTMRLIEGQTLAEAIEALHRHPHRSEAFELGRRRLLQAFVDACQTIHYAHQHGVVHRDLKPQNIIVGNYGETILLDWGLASVIDAEQDPTATLEWDDDPEVLSPAESVTTLQGAVIGTPAYMSPEQARGEFDTIGRQSDVYSLGATLYHLITGQIPFTEGPVESILDRVRQGEITSAVAANESVEPALGAIAARAMNVVSHERYPDVAALLDDVQRFLADQPVSAWRDSLPQRMSRWIRKNPVRASMLALSSLFLLIAAGAGYLVWQAWEDREQQRIAELRVAGERSEATALSQIQGGRYESAAETLAEGAQILVREPALAGLYEDLAERQARIERIVNFYRYSQLAQQETFFDRLSSAGTWCQRALDQIGAFDHPDWWASLPDEDLTRHQAEKLRTEAYRILGLLASMRLAETAEQAFTFDMITKASVDSGESLDPKIVTSIAAAKLAAAQGQRFRPARGLQMIEDVADVVLGIKDQVDLLDIQPLNSIDGAMMGSILDNNVPAEGMPRTAISAFLQFRDPNEVAHEWLDEAMRGNPDWYWLPVFVGSNLTKRGRPEEAIPIFTHALAARPDYWVAWQYRAWASLVAARGEGIAERERARWLGSAARDLQRAMDLAGDQPELFWLQALLYQADGAPLEQVSRAYLKALSLLPKPDEIEEGHYSAITRLHTEELARFVTYWKEQGETPLELRQLEAAVALWEKRHAEALEVCRQALEAYPADPTLLVIREMTRIERNPDSPGLEPIPVAESALFDWQVLRVNAELSRARQDPQAERGFLESARDRARCRWQTSRSLLQLAELELREQNDTEAVRLVEQALTVDGAANLGQFEALAAQRPSSPAAQYCEQLVEARTPKTALRVENSAIETPALINGDFELGLSWYWTGFRSAGGQAAWRNSGSSYTTAKVVEGDAYSGERSLLLDISSTDAPEAFGELRQRFPVEPGTPYEIEIAVRAETMNTATLTLGIADDAGTFSPALTVDDSNEAWQVLKATVTSTTSNMELVLRAQGNGRCWIDAIHVRRAVGK